MKTRAILLGTGLVAVASIVLGCADVAQTDAERQEPVYQTGSNIAKRQRVNQENGVQTMTGEDFQRAMHPAMPAPMPGGAH